MYAIRSYYVFEDQEDGLQIGLAVVQPLAEVGVGHGRDAVFGGLHRAGHGVGIGHLARLRQRLARGAAKGSGREGKDDEQGRQPEES